MTDEYKSPAHVVPGRVDIAIACSPMQAPQWWSGIMGLLLQAQQNGVDIGKILSASTALPDANKGMNVLKDWDSDPNFFARPNQKRRNNLTDANRVKNSENFLHGDAEWIFWIDDDTVPPAGTIEHLLRARRSFIGGVYFLGGHPHNPVAYYREDNGTYAALFDYAPGTLVEVDALGMGCTLIHRSVYEDIMTSHTVFERPNGSLTPVPNVSVKKGKVGKKRIGRTILDEDAGYAVRYEPLVSRDKDDKRPWPFYALEYGRTEDFHFCELAQAAGHKIYLDTTIVCDHWKLSSITQATHDRAVQKERKRQREYLNTLNTDPEEGVMVETEGVFNG